MFDLGLFLFFIILGVLVVMIFAAVLSEAPRPNWRRICGSARGQPPQPQRRTDRDAALAEALDGALWHEYQGWLRLRGQGMNQLAYERAARLEAQLANPEAYRPWWRVLYARQDESAPSPPINLSTLAFSAPFSPQTGPSAAASASLTAIPSASSDPQSFRTVHSSFPPSSITATSPRTSRAVSTSKEAGTNPKEARQR